MHKISEALIKFDEVPVDRDAPKIREGVQSILRRYTLARTTSSFDRPGLQLDFRRADEAEFGVSLLPGT
jgi:hypothetical protein